MKRFSKVLITVISAAGMMLAGCGTAAAPTPVQSETPAAQSVETTPAESAVLVLYYSGTGNTKRIADVIAADTGAAEYEIAPSEPYSSDDLNYNDENSRVVKEYQDESLQDVAFDSYEVPDWDSYDTVFVGYPIWWQDASWVMKSFVSHLDFSGKTVFPFCTSSASGIGDSAAHLEALAGSGNWKEGQRFSRSTSEEDIQNWVSSLGL